MIKIKTMLSLALLSATVVPAAGAASSSHGVQMSQGGMPQESAELEGREIAYKGGLPDNTIPIPENVKEIVKAELPKIMANIEAYNTGQPFFVLDADQHLVFSFSFDYYKSKHCICNTHTLQQGLDSM